MAKINKTKADAIKNDLDITRNELNRTKDSAQQLKSELRLANKTIKDQSIEIENLNKTVSDMKKSLIKRMNSIQDKLHNVEKRSLTSCSQHYATNSSTAIRSRPHSEPSRTDVVVTRHASVWDIPSTYTGTSVKPQHSYAHKAGDNTLISTCSSSSSTTSITHTSTASGNHSATSALPEHITPSVIPTTVPAPSLAAVSANATSSDREQTTSLCSNSNLRANNNDSTSSNNAGISCTTLAPPSTSSARTPFPTNLPWPHKQVSERARNKASSVSNVSARVSQNDLSSAKSKSNNTDFKGSSIKSVINTTSKTSSADNLNANYEARYFNEVASVDDDFQGVISHRRNTKRLALAYVKSVPYDQLRPSLTRYAESRGVTVTWLRVMARKQAGSENEWLLVRVNVIASDFKKALQHDFWPRNVVCREWVSKPMHDKSKLSPHHDDWHTNAHEGDYSNNAYHDDNSYYGPYLDRYDDTGFYT
ncbi:unnamed protein product [Owenia fusiformis]|uniref:Uncharacterized protein n=1 Tax=Owenia fusiformis TaxID=6347 RepID=A0A8S4PCK4_OWEFU|nr:unnamed protein product [Owenia fusiformis]